jgi:hypothetical protein
MFQTRLESVVRVNDLYLIGPSFLAAPRDLTTVIAKASLCRWSCVEVDLMMEKKENDCW